MLYLDVSAAVHSRAGLGRYSEQLALGIHALRPQQTALFFNQGRDGRLPASLAGMAHRSVRQGYKPWRMAVWLAHIGRFGFNPLVPDATLFHSTEHLLMPLRGVPTVLTIHDLIFHLFPAWHKRLNYWYLNRAVPLFARRADRIIAISEATKRDIVQHYGIDPAKIRVVYEAASPLFRPPSADQIAAVRRRHALPDRFLLHLSTIEPRKNLNRLVDALVILRREWPDLHLVLVGSKGWLYDDFFARIERDGLRQVVRHAGWVEDADLPALLASADLAVQPSLYEGFGLPILEQMACGQVVVASNAASHPEVGGEAALYHDPRSVPEMVQQIGRLLRDRDEYAHRQQLGLAWSARFTWQRTAAETLAVYDELLPPG
jgi:glycosyltransferase involved in cell wall biosynthesis